MWVPAAQPVVGPQAAGVSPAALSMPDAFGRFDAPPLFICGSARSGTTWTLDLFAQHPLVYTICESWILTQTHGVTAILAQSYWDLDGRARWQDRVDAPFGAVELMGYETVVRELGELVAKWMVRPAGSEHRYLAAKEPLDVAAAAVMFPEARFVHVIRDGRAVALSMRHAARTWDPTMGPDLSMAFRAEAWRRQVQSVREHAPALGERYLEIRYEDMRRDPVAAMRTLFDFGRIPYDAALLEGIRSATDLTRASDKARHSGFRGGSTNGAGGRMSARDRIGFDRAAGELLVELGYEDTRRGTLRRLLARA